jgi:CSLREA domain-containing protein
MGYLRKVVLIASWILITAARADAGSFVVTSLGDAADATPGDGTCATIASGCTLRAAIEEVNASTDATNLITFSVAGDIVLGARLPNVVRPATIAGSSAPGFTGAPVVRLVLDGVLAPGLAATAGNGEVILFESLEVTGSAGFGISLSGGAARVRGCYVRGNVAGIGVSTPSEIGGPAPADRNVISGNSTAGVYVTSGTAAGTVIDNNFIGVDPSGMTPAGNVEFGVFVAGIASGITIGGNVIGGNGLGIQIESGATDVVVRANLIGTNALGMSAIANTTGLNLSGTATQVIDNTVAGNTNVGLFITGMGAMNNAVTANRIGTAIDGATALPNGTGVRISSGAHDNVLGGLDASSYNVIAGNTGIGVHLNNSATTRNSLVGNFIGVTAAEAPLPNQRGVVITSATFTTVGATSGRGNVIAHNTVGGILVEEGDANHFLRNSIHSNGGLGIDLLGEGVTQNDALDADTGPNGLQNFPVLATASRDLDGTATYVRGTLASTPSRTFSIAVYASAQCDASGHGEGDVFLGTQQVTTDAAGGAALSLALAPADLGRAITAIATDDTSMSTSEFSACVPVAACSAIDVTDAVLSLATAGSMYSESLAATGGTGALTFAVTDGALPAGLSVASDGTLAGTPTESGTFTFTVRATDERGCFDETLFVLDVCPAIEIQTDIPDGTTQTAYDVTLMATGSTIVAFALATGPPPPGTSLASDGRFTGMPTSPGTFTFTVAATDADGCRGLREYDVAIDGCTLMIEPARLDRLEAGVEHETAITASGSLGPYTFELDEGALPIGLELAPDGRLHGTPVELGTFMFVVRVTAQSGCIATLAYTLIIEERSEGGCGCGATRRGDPAALAFVLLALFGSLRARRRS